jgi:hypothetical protein
MKIAFISFLFLVIPVNCLAQTDPLLTYYEKSGFVATPSYDETVAYCKQLDAASPFIQYATFGMSPQGRKLPLLIVDSESRFDPLSARRAGKVVWLIVAGIHPGEIDGKDAGFMFLRDLAIQQQFGGVPQNITILFVPIFNVDGHERFGPYNRINQDGPEEMGWRTTAQNLNLNRDFLKADAPEMQAWLKLFQQWLPDFFMDIHVTDGADYQYVMTYGLETFGNMDAGLTEWSMEKLIPVMEKKMDEAGYPAFPYVMFRKWHDPRSGLRSGAAGPRYSQGYAAAQNRIGLLVENHSLKDYRTRVSGTYELLKIINGLLQSEASALVELNQLADEYAASAAFRDEPFPVAFSAGKDSVMVEFRGVEYDVVKSDLTGGDWFIYYPDKPKTYQVPYFNHQSPSKTVALPEAYIIPPEWTEVTEKLGLHGIQYTVLKEPAKFKVQTFKFRDYSWSKTPYEGRLSLTTSWDTIYQEKIYPAGSVVINTDQRTSRVMAHMLEPLSPDSYLTWGFFNAIFEMKEYFETYSMEEYARKMCEEDPVLKAQFELWKKDHPEVQDNQYAQLEWFFVRSPYFDKQKDVYPIGKILGD